MEKYIALHDDANATAPPAGKQPSAKDAAVAAKAALEEEIEEVRADGCPTQSPPLLVPVSGAEHTCQGGAARLTCVLPSVSAYLSHAHTCASPYARRSRRDW